MATDTQTGKAAPSGPPKPRSWRSRRPLAIEPLHLLGVAFVVVVLFKAASEPLVDPDAPWHVRLGSELLNGTPPTAAGHGWTFAPVDDSHWVSTQWLAELAMAWLYRLFGWNGLLLLRAVCAAALLGLLAWTLLPHRPARLAIPVFLVAGSPLLMLAVQERPQSLSFLLLVPLAWWALRIVKEGRLPSAWIALLLSVVWANVHGEWIMLPAVLTLAAIGRWVDHGVRDPVASRTIGLATASLVSGVISPGGIGTVTAVLRFHAAAGQIAEWQPVSLFKVSSAPLVLWAGLVVTAWARGRSRTPRSELVFVGLLLLFGLSAYRNVLPALLLTAPFVIQRADIAWQPSRSPTTVRERRWLIRAAVITGAVGVVGSLTAAAVRPPFPKEAPVALIEQVSGRPEGSRVLPEYNESGLVLAIGGPATRTGIDGRADLFGATYISEYLTMLKAGYGWQSTLRKLNPTSAILSRKTRLAKELQRCSWRVQASTTTHVLLVPTPGWTCPSTD